MRFGLCKKDPLVFVGLGFLVLLIEHRKIVVSEMVLGMKKV